MRGVAAIVYRGPMAKFFSWTIFTHDFELYPFDRELSYDFGWVVVMLIQATLGVISCINFGLDVNLTLL